MRGVVLLSGASKCLMKVQVSLCQAGLPLAAESRSGAGLTLCAHPAHQWYYDVTIMRPRHRSPWLNCLQSLLDEDYAGGHPKMTSRQFGPTSLILVSKRPLASLCASSIATSDADSAMSVLLPAAEQPGPCMPGAQPDAGQL